MSESGALDSISITVNISHTYIADLLVRLESPAGTIATLHSRSGGSTDDINETYTPSTLTGRT